MNTVLNRDVKLTQITTAKDQLMHRIVSFNLPVSFSRF